MCRCFFTFCNATASAIAVLMIGGGVSAQTLAETFAETLRANPTIRAERAMLDATREQRSQAISAS